MAKVVLDNVASGYDLSKINNNFQTLATALENTLSRDGTTPNSMSADLDMNGQRILNSVAQSGDGFIWQSAWITGTAYELNNLVSNSGNSYICLVDHTAGTFATDLAAGKWELFVAKGATGAGTGDMLASNNLSDVVNVATARTNLGVGTSSSPEFTAINIGHASDTTLTRVSAGVAAVEGATIITTAPGTSGNVLTSNGTIWTSAAPTGGGGAGGAQIQPISAVANTPANALTISAPSLTLDFRSATLTSGTVTTVTGDPADLVVSRGSTLGTVSGIASRLAVIAMNNAGTIELAVRNVSAGANLDEGALISTTAEGGAGAADSATVNYSTTARSNLAFRVIGYIESTQATAGTWATAPSTIQGEGGNAHALSDGVLSAPVTASGTAVDFTGIPAFTKTITIGYLGLSTNGGADLLVQIGPVGGIETSGYLSSSSGCAGGVASVNSTAGFISYVDSASSIQQGFLTLTLLDAATNTWGLSGVLGNSDAARTVICGGQKPLAGMLERVRITTVGGSETFDAGSIVLKTSRE
jgi:hypothetical protein